jgi:choline-sulfatase
VRFSRAYCTNPVCVPSRFSMFTGYYPSKIGQRANPSRHLDPIPEEISSNGMGWLLRRAGYETVYGGKVHLPKDLDPEKLGFDVLTADERWGLADQCADYLRGGHRRPFALVASFINPHDICYMGIRDFAQSDFDRLLLEKGETELAALDWALGRPEGVSEDEFFEKHCPPAPPNFDPQDDEPEAVKKLVEERGFRKDARQKWSERRWREHRWAYARLTERVDEQIGRVLDALRESGLEETTVVIFTSDHGDHDSAHRLEHKTALYEEAMRVPFIIADLNADPAGHVEDRLVSNGLDLVPTFCDYAGVEPPADLKGVSLRPLVEGHEPEDWRQALVVESQLGYSVVGPRYKYALYDEGENREQLYDLREDSYETRNFAGDADKEEVLERCRVLYEEMVTPVVENPGE